MILFYQDKDHNVWQIKFYVVKDVSVRERHFSDNLIYRA